MRLRQSARLVAAVPVVAPWAPMVVAGAAGLLLVGLGNAETGGVMFDLRVSGAIVAATTALMIDDPAAATLASSPTTLVARRGARVAVAVVFVAAWWCAAAAIARERGAHLPAAPLLAEVAVLTALAVLGSIAAQRWSGDGRGGSAGAFVAVLWFVLSFVPRVGAIPLPPQPMHPGTAGPLLAVTGLALGMALQLSKDPARRTRMTREPTPFLLPQEPSRRRRTVARPHGQLRLPTRSRCGPMVAAGSAADSKPARNTARRVSRLPAASSTPAGTAAARRRPASASTAPAAVAALAALASRPASPLR